MIFTVDRYDEALVALRDAGVPAVSEDAIIIRIADEPGALARLSRGSTTPESGCAACASFAGAQDTVWWRSPPSGPTGRSIW